LNPPRRFGFKAKQRVSRVSMVADGQHFQRVSRSVQGPGAVDDPIDDATGLSM